MAINNLNIIKDLLNFSENGDFYMLYVMKRKKDQPENQKDNHQSVRIIKTYCIESVEYLDNKYDEIKSLCEFFYARAYIHIQKQNHKDVSLQMMVELAQRIKNGVTKQQGLFDSVVGQIKTNEKRWIIDIDTKDEKVKVYISNLIDTIQPVGSKIEAVIPTKNGYHLITRKFNVLEFQKLIGDNGPTIVKKNPTLLYLPDSLS